MRLRKESADQWRSAPRPTDWTRRIVPRILQRDPTCQLRTHCDGAPSREVDHIGDPADHTDDNLRGVCTPCHAYRTAQQANAARWSRPAARRQRPAPKHPGLR